MILTRKRIQQPLERQLQPAFDKPAFLALPGQPRPVVQASQLVSFPADVTAGLYGGTGGSTTTSYGLNGPCVVTNTTVKGVAFARVGANDAYIETPSGSDFTWVFQTEKIGYVGTNPGYFRNSSGGGSTFILTPTSGLWVRLNGSDFTSSVAMPAAGASATVVVSVRSGKSVKGWVNGVQVLNATTAATTAAMTGVDGVNIIGVHSVSNGEYLTGNHTIVGHWHRAFSDSDSARLSVNPWQMFAPTRRLAIAAASANVTLGLTGLAATGAAGTLAPSSSKAITGLAGTGAVGTVSVGLSKALTGAAAASAVGSVVPSSATALTGTAGTATVGSVSITGDGQAALTGIAATGAAGTVSPSITLPIAGVASSGAVGSLTTAQTLGLTGISATGAVGSVTFVGDVSVALAGVSVSGVVGSLAASGGDVIVSSAAGRGRAVERHGRLWYFEDEEELEAWEAAQVVPTPNRPAKRALKRALEASFPNALAPTRTEAKAAQKAVASTAPKALPIPFVEPVQDDEDEDLAILLMF